MPQFNYGAVERGLKAEFRQNKPSVGHPRQERPTQPNRQHVPRATVYADIPNSQVYSSLSAAAKAEFKVGLEDIHAEKLKAPDPSTWKVTQTQFDYLCTSHRAKKPKVVWLSDKSAFLIWVLNPKQ